MSETKVLPCGTVLTKRDGGEWYILEHRNKTFGYRPSEGEFQAAAYEVPERMVGTDAEALAWLNARVLALRAALLPPDAVVVRLDAETREAVARRLWRLDAAKPQHYAWTLDWPGLAPGSWAIGYGEQADAVLDALRERGR